MAGWIRGANGSDGGDEFHAFSERNSTYGGVVEMVATRDETRWITGILRKRRPSIPTSEKRNDPH